MATMNILYGIDEGKKDYSRYLGISILSLLKYNKSEDIHIYILSKYIEESNKQELIRIVKSYGKKISFSEGEIVPSNYKEILYLRGGWPMATYYRFFFGEKFDIRDRVLYIDCDTIINNNLSKFYNIDFHDNIIVGEMDAPVGAYSNSKKYGLSKYINAGVCLININLFKKVDLYKEILEINKKYGIPDYNDQDYINIIFKDKIYIYKNLQCLVTYKRVNYKINDYLILHTVNKPNIGGYSLCPKKIEELFNGYLAQTKWKSYIGWQRKRSLKLFIGYVFDNIRALSIYLSLKYIGVEFASKVHYIFGLVTVKTGSICRKLKLIKQC